MANLWKRTEALKWWPDADAMGAPEWALLRALNTIPDRHGVRSLRQGSTSVYSAFDDTRVHTLYAAELDGILHRIAGADNRVYDNGVLISPEEFDGSGDIAMGDDAYQILMARGATRKKFDGANFHNWTINSPSLAPQVLAVNAITDEVCSFDSTESPALTIHEGTSNFVNDYSGTANGALELIPNSDGKASASKVFAADQDYLDIGGAIGGNTDLFDMRVYFENWKKVDKVTVMFGLGTGTDPFLDDYYYFDWKIKDQEEVDIKDPVSNAVAAFSVASAKAVGSLTPAQITNIRTPAQAGNILRKLGRYVGPTSTERRDSQQSSPAWGHLSVTRGQFTRVGGTYGKNWTTVRAFKVVYTTVTGTTKSAYFDDAIWTGGGARSLTGSFTVGYRFARRFQTADSTDVYYELSPMSPISEEITLKQQTLQVTIPSSALAGADAQVTEIWAYIQGGWLDTYYRFVILPSTVRTGLTIDELTSPVGSNFDSPEKRTRLTAWGFTISPGAGAQSTDVVFTGNLSEMEILIDNEAYVPGTMPVPENIVAVAGPHMGRMYLLDSEGWLHPTGTAPSDVSAYHAIDLRKYGTPYWAVKTASGIVVGLSKDIVYIEGDGSESEDRVIVNLYATPFNVGNPPVDGAVMVDGNTVTYRAADGPMVLNTATSTPVPYNGTMLLWKGEDRHGVRALNLSGRFRFEVDNHVLYMLAPEGEDDPTAIWKFNGEEWMRHTYPFNPVSIFREPSGSLVVGTDDGAVWEIETGIQDDDEDIPIDIVTPVSDGGDPLRRKDAIDFQIHLATGSNIATVDFFKDGNTTPTVTMDVESPVHGVHRSDLTGLGVFLRSQIEITGSFSEFSLFGFNIAYRSRPQQVMVLDPGYVIPENGGDMAWLTEAILDCASPANLNILIYRDDVLYEVVPVVVRGGDIRTQYRVSLPRGSKARRLRLVVKTTNPAGYSNPGFEPWYLKARQRGSGNWTTLIDTMGDAA